MIPTAQVAQKGSGSRANSAQRVVLLVLHDPLGQLWPHPEGVDAERDNDQEEPLDPVAEQARCGAGEAQSAAVEVGVLCLPAVASVGRSFLTGRIYAASA